MGGLRAGLGKSLLQLAGPRLMLQLQQHYAVVVLLPARRQLAGVRRLRARGGGLEVGEQQLLHADKRLKHRLRVALLLLSARQALRHGARLCVSALLMRLVRRHGCPRVDELLRQRGRLGGGLLPLALRVFERGFELLKSGALLAGNR